MSKKNRRRLPPITAQDRHHICFIKSKWNSGYAGCICKAFVRYVPIVYHRKLHAKLRYVPVPDRALIRKAWYEYLENKDEIDKYDICRAIAWLYVHIPDVDFRKAMQFQLDFFTRRMDRSV